MVGSVQRGGGPEGTSKPAGTLSKASRAPTFSRAKPEAQASQEAPEEAGLDDAALTAVEKWGRGQAGTARIEAVSLRTPKSPQILSGLAFSFSPYSENLISTFSPMSQLSLCNNV